MWATIGTLFTTLLPLILKLVMFIIEKKQDSDKLRQEFLKFLTEIEHDVPVKLHDRYNEQIARIKAELGKGGPTDVPGSNTK